MDWVAKKKANKRIAYIEEMNLKKNKEIEELKAQIQALENDIGINLVELQTIEEQINETPKPEPVMVQEDEEGEE